MIFTSCKQSAGRNDHKDIGNKYFKQVPTFGKNLDKSEVQARRN
jgi:hypothetical protein